MAQVVRSIKFNNSQKIDKKERMVKAISFKERERPLWEHLNDQLDPIYYVKYLILKDMQDANVNGKRIVQDTNGVIEKDVTVAEDYLNIEI